jgi:hypothetical protein
LPRTRTGLGTTTAWARAPIIPRSGQYVSKEIVEYYLKQINFADDKFASKIRLPHYGDANVVLDPR